MSSEMKSSMFQLMELQCIHVELKILNLTFNFLLFSITACNVHYQWTMDKNNSHTQYLLYKKRNPGAQVSYVVKDTNAIWTSCLIVHELTFLFGMVLVWFKPTPRVSSIRLHYHPTIIIPALIINSSICWSTGWLNKYQKYFLVITFT